MNHHQAVVIGAGVGGLSAAAYLTKAGVRTLVIERTPFPGGRCYSRTIDGAEYDIGALYIGSRAPEILETEFGINCSFSPYKMGIKMGDSLVSVPFGVRSLIGLHAAGATWWDILSFLPKIRELFRKDFLDCHPSAGEAVDALTSSEVIRRMWYVLLGVSGVNPYSLPSSCLNMSQDAVGTKIGNPVHFAGGNRQMADSLVAFIATHGGRLAFEETVEGLLLHGPRVCGVVTDHGEYTADYVISNADIRTTVLQLGASGSWEAQYVQEIQSIEPSLSVTCVFLKLDSAQDLPDGYGVFFAPGESPIKEFETLNAGRFPDRSMFILHVPTNLEGQRPSYHHATLQFYCPRGTIAREAVEQRAQQVMTEGLDSLFPGLSRRVASYFVFDPTRYEQEFGLRPYVFGASPTLARRRLAPQTPIVNLMCVGDSVLPERPSVPQAMESGILGAQEVLRQMETGSGHAPDRPKIGTAQ